MIRSKIDLFYVEHLIPSACAHSVKEKMNEKLKWRRKKQEETQKYLDLLACIAATVLIFSFSISSSSHFHGFLQSNNIVSLLCSSPHFLRFPVFHWALFPVKISFLVDKIRLASSCQSSFWVISLILLITTMMVITSFYFSWDITFHRQFW